MYLPAIYAGLIVGFIGTMAIAINRRELHILILTDIVVNATQSKVFINGLPVTIYGAICSCGDIVTGSKINDKIFIKP